MDIEKCIKELTLEEKASLCSGRDYWHTKEVERLSIPSVMMCDGPHGLRKQEGNGDIMGIGESIEAVCFPSASAMAASWDRELIKELGSVLGAECLAEGVSMLLGPGLNMKRSPLCGRNFEYFSEDPYLAGEMGASYIKGLQDQGVAACVKHFAANNQETRRMSSSSQVDERTLPEIYLPAFETVVKKGKVHGVMCAYNALNGTNCSQNKELLTDTLRSDWGYQGITVTDWGAVDNRVMGLIAGLDLEMPGGPGAQDHKIIEAVKNGTLDEAVLDEAVYNLLRFIKGSQEKQGKFDKEKFDKEKDHETAVKMAKECAVLLKNEDGLLPLTGGQKIAFIGEFAVKPRFQGAGSSHIHTENVKGAWECVQDRNVLYARGYDSRKPVPDVDLIEEAAKLAEECDVAVIFAGLPDSFESEGIDRTTMDMPEGQNALIHAVSRVQKNLIVVLHGGAPFTMPWLSDVSAVLLMYLSGEGTGEAAAALLLGECSPCGKLAETFPMKLTDTPAFFNFPGERGIVEYREGIYIGYRYYDKRQMAVLFPFGHGLSYTSFSYSGLKFNKEQMTEGETLILSFLVKNTGACKGKEIVQLYVSDESCSVGRPLRELKEFAKVELNPGEEKEITFYLDQRAFAYYEPLLHDWYVESGIFTIEIGASSRDIRLTAQIDVTGIKDLPQHVNRNTTLGELMLNSEGRKFVEQFLAAKTGSDVSALGEGSQERVAATIHYIPLKSLVTFGRLTEHELDKLIQEINSGN